MSLFVERVQALLQRAVPLQFDVLQIELKSGAGILDRIVRMLQQGKETAAAQKQKQR
jgi:hypothetical protein